jgi:hypothetical protein
MTLLWVGNIIDSPSAMLGHTTARASDDGPALAVRLMRQEFINSLSKLIGESADVLAIHTRESAPYTEVVLWRSDTANPGVIDADELTVVSHCRLFKTVTLYEAVGIPPPGATVSDQPEAASRQPIAESPPPRPGVPRPGAAAGPGSLGGQGLRVPGASVAANMMLDRTLASHPGFCDRWRGSPQVQPRVLGTDLSDFNIEPTGPAGDELSVLRLSLRWADDSTDGAQDVAVVIKRRSALSTQRRTLSLQPSALSPQHSPSEQRSCAR